MTSQTRTLIEPSDIRALQLECPDCGVQVVYPLNKLDQLSVACPNCHIQWFATNPPNMPPGAKQPIEYIKEALVGLRAISGHKVKVWVEIKGQNSN